MKKTPLPSPALRTQAKNVRLTITVTPEVHASFKRLSEASSISIGRAMGEWLGDTLDAVDYTALMVDKARSAPKMVMKELHAYSLGLADETGSMLKKIREKGNADRSKANG